MRWPRPQAGRQSQIAPGSGLPRPAGPFALPFSLAHQRPLPHHAGNLAQLGRWEEHVGKQSGDHNGAGRQHVLVVDADLRLPTQHTIFNVCSVTACRRFLQALDVDQAIQPTGIEGLDSSRVGRCRPAQLKMLNSSTFARLA